MSQFTMQWANEQNAKRLKRNANGLGIKAELPNPKPRERQASLAGDSEGKAQGAGCPVVRFTLRRVKLLDVDAKYASVKDLLDGLAIAGIIRGDKEGEIRLEVEQVKVGHYEEERTVIEVKGLR